MVPARGRDRHLAVTVVAAAGRRGLAARRGRGHGRPDAAHARAEGRGLGRGGAQAGARDQEPAHAHPALGPARAQGVPEVGARLRAACSTECTGAIVAEVDALKNLVDEFAQFARLPAANLATGVAARAWWTRRCRSTTGCSPSVRIDRRLAPDVPALRLDADQMKRVLINLVDNAIEATEKKGTVVVSTEFDRAHGPRPAGRGRRRPRHPPGGPATSCSCRTSRPSGAGSGLGPRRS